MKLCRNGHRLFMSRLTPNYYRNIIKEHRDNTHAHYSIATASFKVVVEFTFT